MKFKKKINTINKYRGEGLLIFGLKMKMIFSFFQNELKKKSTNAGIKGVAFLCGLKTKNENDFIHFSKMSVKKKKNKQKINKGMRGCLLFWF